MASVRSASTIHPPVLNGTPDTIDKLVHHRTCLQIDNAIEFLTFTKFLQNLGIMHRLSCPHTHEQNKSAKRKHRHIVETSLTLLPNASLPITF